MKAWRNAKSEVAVLATLVMLVGPARSQTLPVPEDRQAVACAAPDRLPGDRAAKAKRQLYRGIGVNAAICVAGTPSTQDQSNNGQSIDALRYSDGRVLVFRDNQLQQVAGPGAKPLGMAPIEEDEIDPDRKDACTKAKVKRITDTTVRIGDSRDRVRCLLGPPSDIRDLETASAYLETLFYMASDGTITRTITLRNGRVSAIQNRY